MAAVPLPSFAIEQGGARFWQNRSFGMPFGNDGFVPDEAIPDRCLSTLGAPRRLAINPCIRNALFTSKSVR